MQEAWSIIDVLLKKRYELVPNLVDTVKGYNLYEMHLLEEIALLRTEAMQDSLTETKVKTESLFGNKVNQLLLHVEKYPELKANNHFLKLQLQLSEIENELEKARRYYNGTVRINNIGLESFPSNLIGRLCTFSKGIFFGTMHTDER